MKGILYSIFLLLVSLAMFGYVVYWLYPCFDNNAPSTVMTQIVRFEREIPVDETSDVQFIFVNYKVGLHKYKKILSHEYYYTGLEVGDSIEIPYYKKSLSDFSTLMRIELTAITLGGIIIMAYAVSRFTVVVKKQTK